MTNPAPTPFQPNPGPAGAYPATPTPRQPAYRGTPVPPAYQQAFPQQPAYQPQPYPQRPTPYGAPNPADTGSFGWAVLGFFIPLAGLILFLVWKNDRPLSARKAGMGALVSVIVTVAIYILVFVIAIVAAVASAS